jgi:hypothetical protein
MSRYVKQLGLHICKAARFTYQDLNYLFFNNLLFFLSCSPLPNKNNETTTPPISKKPNQFPKFKNLGSCFNKEKKILRNQ